MASVSLFDFTIGKALNFIVTSGGSAVDLTGANVTILVDNNIEYPASIVSALSGTVRYTVSAGDFPNPQQLTGQLRVSFGTNRFFSVSTFDILVRKSIGRC